MWFLLLLWSCADESSSGSFPLGPADPSVPPTDAVAIASTAGDPMASASAAGRIATRVPSEVSVPVEALRFDAPSAALVQTDCRPRAVRRSATPPPAYRNRGASAPAAKPSPAPGKVPSAPDPLAGDATGSVVGAGGLGLSGTGYGGGGATEGLGGLGTKGEGRGSKPDAKPMAEASAKTEAAPRADRDAPAPAMPAAAEPAVVGGLADDQGPAAGPVPSSPTADASIADNKERTAAKRPEPEGKKDKALRSPSEDQQAEEGRRGARLGDEREEELAKARAPEPVLDWGATVYLSNDDSMSLASAQRLLWAVGNNAPFGAQEVRPHELLNYFTFDTAPVDPSRTFSVLGAATQSGDTLTVGLAVRGAVPARQPLDLTLVVDRSGSMSAEGRMDFVKRGLLQMTAQLVPGDRVDLVLFDSGVCSPLVNYVVGRDDPGLLTQEISAIQPNTATDLSAGMREAYRAQTSRTDTEGRNRRILLLTDAFLNEGMVDADLLSEVGRHYDEAGIRVTGVGVGREFNDAMLDKLTEKSKGSYVYLGSEAVVDRVFGLGFRSLVQTIAHDVQFSIELPDSLAMTRFYGEESSTNPAEVQPIHYYAGTSQVFLQELKLRGGRPDRDAKITLRARYDDPRTGQRREEQFDTTVGALLAADPHNVNKALALMRWSDLLLERAMGDRSCSALPAFAAAAAAVPGDAELGYVASLTGGLCGRPVETSLVAGVPFKVRLNSDIPIPEVELRCGPSRWTQPLTGSDQVASFAAIPSGSCSLLLQGAVPMQAAVQVPSTGGAISCMSRGGRLSCG